MTLQEKTTTVNGQTVHYWEAGAELPRALLLLHGGMGDAKLHWASCMPLLAEEFRTIAPDLPGFGGSAPLSSLSIENLLAWIKGFIDHLGLEQMALIGNDFGALLARLFGAAYPLYAPALVLVNGGSIPNIPPMLRTLARTSLVGDVLFYLLARSTLAPAQLKRMIHAKEVLTDDFKTQVRASVPAFAHMMRLWASDPIPEKRKPPLPTLLLWGAEDPIAPLDEAERIKSAIPGAVVSPIAECGHMPQLEASEVFAWQVTQFLNDPGRAAKTELPGVGLL